MRFEQNVLRVVVCPQWLRGAALLPAAKAYSQIGLPALVLQWQGLRVVRQTLRQVAFQVLVEIFAVGLLRVQL